MSASLTSEAKARLEKEENIWFASQRPDGSPHLAPVWFAFWEEKLYVCIEANSVKGRNVQNNPFVVLALEGGLHPVICEGRARAVEAPWPDPVAEIFQQKYHWDIVQDGQYDLLLAITPRKRLTW